MPADKAQGIAAARDEIEACLTPCDVQSFAVIIDKLFRFLATFGIEIDTKEATGHYREALRGFPTWALSKAVANIAATWRWSRAPLPADLRSAMPPELWQLLGERRRLMVAERILYLQAREEGRRNHRPVPPAVFPPPTTKPPQMTAGEAEAKLRDDKKRTEDEMRRAGLI